jgi:AcrR family transcriptional regulator
VLPEPLVSAALGLPAVPGPELDAYIDAAARCIARHGLRRTRVVDIADEVGVSRVTVYRQLGTIDEAARLLLARELDRLSSAVAPRLWAAASSGEVVDVVVDAVVFAVDHPVLAKVLRDEADLVGAFVVAELRTLLERLRLLADPVLGRLAALGCAPALDAGDLADLLGRLLVTVVVSPPSEDLRSYLRRVLGALFG